jgi:SAM-dependent methyltransferase
MCSAAAERSTSRALGSPTLRCGPPVTDRAGVTAISTPRRQARLHSRRRSVSRDQPIDSRDAAYVAHITASLEAHYFAHAAPGYLASPAGRADLDHHVHARYDMFARHHVPWLRRRFDLAAMHLIEVGCGTGSATLAFGSNARALDCYELSAPARAIAAERLRFWGIQNVRFHSVPFDETVCATRAEPVDGVLLTASLEHMTHVEAIGILRLCRSLLRPGGILVICETPNRFTLFDDHTSRLPLFSMLPRAIQVGYAHHSPRLELRQAIHEALQHGLEHACETMTRWGSGVSFHEFEIGLGPSVHTEIELDGYEPEITAFFAVTDRDRDIENLFTRAGVRVNRAFTRHYLNFVWEKPLG